MHAPWKTPWHIALAGLVLATSVVLLATPGGAADPRTVSVAGPLTVYAVAGNPAAGVTAAVHEAVTGSGTTIVTLHLAGFAPSSSGQTFGAHAHTGPCGSDGADAGPHYTHPALLPSLEEKEIWLDFTVNPAGQAHAKAIRAWTIEPTTAAPSGARSVVIHAMPTAPAGTAGARLACIDVPFVG